MNVPLQIGLASGRFPEPLLKFFCPIVYLRPLLLVMLALTFLRSTEAQEVNVLVLDALSGKPEAQAEVWWFCAGLPVNSNPQTIITNEIGLASAYMVCGERQHLDLMVFTNNRKEQCGGDTQLTVEEAAAKGFVSDPSSAGGIWCPSKKSKTLRAVPGQVVIFVKKPTWWQSHIAG